MGNGLNCKTEKSNLLKKIRSAHEVIKIFVQETEEMEHTNMSLQSKQVFTMQCR